MINKALLLLLSAQSGLAALTLNLTRSAPPPPATPNSESPIIPALKFKQVAAVNEDVVRIGNAPEELTPALTDRRMWFTIDVTFGAARSESQEGADSTNNEPQQTYKLLLDSGARDFWVMQQGCVNCSWQGVDTPSGYTLSASGSNTSVAFEIADDSKFINRDVTVKGFDVVDTVSLSGPDASVNLTFTVANTISGFPMSSDLSGIFPIGPGKYNHTGDPAVEADFNKGPIRKLKEANVISNEDVGFSVNGATPSLTIGGIDEAFTYDSAAMANVSSVSLSKYVVPVDSITVAGQVVASSESVFGLQAWIDTGATYWSAPRSLWQAFYQAIPGGKFIYGDDGMPQYGILPEIPQEGASISVSINGKTFVINYNSLVNTDTNLVPPNNTGYRYGTLFKTDDDDPSNRWIFGLSFLENVYVSFNPYWNRICVWPLSDADKGSTDPNLPAAQLENSPAEQAGKANENATQQTASSGAEPSSSTLSAGPSSLANDISQFSEVVDSSTADPSTQPTDQPTITTTWVPGVTTSVSSRGAFTWHVNVTDWNNWVPVEVTVTPNESVGPTETVPPPSEPSTEIASDYTPAQPVGLENENTSDPVEPSLGANPSPLSSEQSNPEGADGEDAQPEEDAGQGEGDNTGQEEDDDAGQRDSVPQGSNNTEEFSPPATSEETAV